MSNQTQLVLVASVLRRGRQVERVSDAISLLALAYGLAPLAGAPTHAAGGVLCALLLIAGLLQKFWGMRIALDAELFAHLASQAEALAPNTRALDQALFDLGLKPTAVDARDWQARSQATLRLMRQQLLCLGVQVLLAIAGVLSLPWLSSIG